MDQTVGDKLKKHAERIKGDSNHPGNQILHDDHSEAHQIFRSRPGHRSTLTIPNKSKKDEDATKGEAQAAEEEEKALPGMTAPGSTGVIYVMDRASANGFTYENEEWANLGQGAPQVGDIPECSERPKKIDLEAMGEGVNEYGPTTGIKELREAVAHLYNDTYRKNKQSKYTHENVCIVPGGRAGLSRVAAVIGDVYVSYQVPEYTSYSQMLEVFRKLVPVPTILKKDDGYKMDVERLRQEVKEMGVSVVVLSNPRNPTGQVIEGEELKELVGLSRDGTTLVLDEFYSWYQYEHETGVSLSAAEYIEDVDKDPVVVIDGLTKNWRLPGWRCCWVVGPKNFISALGQSGSFLDGGASHPLQVAAIPLLEPSRVHQDKIALQKLFKHKRDVILERLEAMGLKVQVPPKATFYIWLDVSSLPPPLDSGLVFFEELLKEKVIVVPGIFFDINPSKRRNLFDSPAHTCLDGIERVLQRAHGHVDEGKHLHEHFGRDLVKSPVRSVFGSDAQGIRGSKSHG